jgi:hypothetical protein
MTHFIVVYQGSYSGQQFCTGAIKLVDDSPKHYMGLVDQANSLDGVAV